MSLTDTSFDTATSSMKHDQDVVPMEEEPKSCAQVDILLSSQAESRLITSEISTCIFSHLWSITYHFRTLHLFTYSSLKDTVLPCTLFALFGTLSGPVLGFPAPSLTSLVVRTPLALLWTWLNILVFCLHNQRHPESVAEDAVNKPWRPLPAKRITPAQVSKLLLTAWPLSFLLSIYVGGAAQVALLAFLILWYNEWGGADRNGFIRNFLNAAGYCCFLSGALQVTAGVASPADTVVYNEKAMRWVLMVAVLIFTTIQLQDFRDEPGDRTRGRKTILSLVGDASCRWTVVIAVAFWSAALPAMWGLRWEGYAGPVVFGTTIVVRILTWRGVDADKLTYKVWCLWLMSFFAVPWLKLLVGYS